MFKSFDEQRLQALIDGVKDHAILMLDPQGRVTTWTASAERIKGYCATEIVGRSFACFYTPEDIQRGHPEEVLRIAAQDGHFEEDGWRVCKDGSRFWANVMITTLRDEAGQVAGFSKMTRDITERKRNQDMLRDGEQCLRTLIEGIKDYAILMLDPQGRVTTWTACAERIKGYSAKEIVGQSFACFYTPEDIQRGHPEEVLRIAAQEGHFEEDGWRVCKDGSRFWARVMITALRDKAGQITGFSKMTRDITERKKTQDERRIERLQLVVERQRAEDANLAKSRFLANVSHEIRTPMNGVIGMLQLLLLTDLTPTQQHYANVARNSGQVLLALISDILDLSKIEAGKIVIENRDFNLRDVLADVIEPVRLQATGKGLQIHSSVSPDIPPLLRSDAHRLRQVLTNLLANAIKFTERGEVALVAIAENRENGRATIRFTISDTGIGIPEDRHGMLFLPFVQADDSTTRKYGGTGLGLCICKQLVGMLGGSIGVSSREGQGSTFWFTIVVEAPPAQQLPEVAPPDGRFGESGNTPLIGRSERILVADDNLVNRMVLRAQLQQIGYEVGEVTNGAEAVEAVQQGGYGLVLMDCHMPVMDGFEAARRIRGSVRPSVPIIAVTADAMSEVRDRCLREGMSDYIAKPVELKLLANMIAKWLPHPTDQV